MADVQPVLRSGHLPQHVPALTQVNRETLALAVRLPNVEPIDLGDVAQHFALMSLMKPFLLLFLFSGPLGTGGYLGDPVRSPKFNFDLPDNRSVFLHATAGSNKGRL